MQKHNLLHKRKRNEDNMDDERAEKIRETLRMFREICREKNKPEMPCAGCPLWSVCGTLPGSLDDATIEDTAADVAIYYGEKEAADAETALPVQPGAE